MGRNQNTRALISRYILAAVFAGAVVFASASAQAESTRRVVVTEFAGPEKESKQARKTVLEVLEELYDIVPYRKYRIEGRRMGAHKKKSKRKSIKKVCKRVGCDAIIYGQLEKKRLTVKVREGDSGRMIGKFRISVSKIISDSVTDELENELVDLIDATAPVEASQDTLVEKISPSDSDVGSPRGEGQQARAWLASTSAASAPVKQSPGLGPLARRSWDETPPQDDEDSSKSAIGIQAMFGVAGTARTLKFNYKSSLAADERPLELAGSPAFNAAFTTVADLKAIGVSAEFHFARSLGASASYADGDAKKTLNLKQQHWGGRLFYRRAVSRRVTLRGGAGYHQLAFEIKNRPAGLTLPDSRYSYADIGGGIRLLLRDDRVAITADAAYVHVLGSSGITDKKSYGRAQILGFGSEAGIELEASASTFVRVAVSYSFKRLLFDGTGELATNLDNNSDVDLSAAVDVLFGGSALIGFHF